MNIEVQEYKLCVFITIYNVNKKNCNLYINHRFAIEFEINNVLRLENHNN